MPGYSPIDPNNPLSETYSNATHQSSAPQPGPNVDFANGPQAGAPGALTAPYDVPGKNGGLFGIGDDHTLRELAQMGYQFYTPTGAPDLSQYFRTDQNPELQFRQGEIDLMNRLHGQSLGNGPSAAIGTLTAGRDANAANLMAALASGRGSPGTASGALAASAMAGQQAANQAAIIRAQEQQSAEQQLGGVTSQGAAGDLAEQQLRANQAANLGNYQESNWQYLNNLNAAQRGDLNQVLAAAEGAAVGSQRSLLPTAINAAAGVGAAGASAFGKTPQPIPAAHGAVVDHPQVRLMGEAGPEAIVPIHPDGSPDMRRATDPKLKWILESHGASSYSVPGAKASGMPGPLPAADHGILGQIVALRHDIQNLMRGR